VAAEDMDMGDASSDETSKDDDFNHAEDESFHLGVAEMAATDETDGDADDNEDGDVENDEAENAIEEEETDSDEDRDIESHVQKTAYPQKPIIRVPQKLGIHQPEDYKVTGATKKLRKLRIKDLRLQRRDASNCKFQTSFQQDCYETVIITKNNIVLRLSGLIGITCRI
jgi:hypothetical protein